MSETSSDFQLETTLTVPDGQSGKRLDQFLPKFLADSLGFEKSRSQIQEWIKAGFFLLNGKATKPRAEIAAGDVITARVPADSSPIDLEPEDLPLEVLHEDEHIIVVNKAPGMVVHPGSGNARGTLVNALLHHCRGQLSYLADEGRPGIVHRLDKETSGCLVAAKSDLAYQSLVKQFSNRNTEKHYVAIAAGVPAEMHYRIENHIGRHPKHRQKMAVVEPPAGKEAISEFEVSHHDPERRWSWIRCRIFTGRTHQIRVHLKECLRCPILGDTIYAQPRKQSVKVPRLMLHARKLTVRHPDTQKETRFEAPLPEAFLKFEDQSSLGV